MAAAVATYNQTNIELTKNVIKKVQNEASANPRKPLGIIPFKTKAFAVVATQVDDVGDETYGIIAPPNCLLGDLYITFTDMDSHVSPTLEVRLQAQTAGGTETVLSAATTIGAAATTVAMQNSSKFSDVSSQYLGFEVTGAAATFAAGTFTMFGYFIVGTENKGYAKFN